MVSWVRPDRSLSYGTPSPSPSPRWSTSHMTELDMHVTSHEMIVSATAMAPPFHGNLSIDLVSALRTTNHDLNLSLFIARMGAALFTIGSTHKVIRVNISLTRRGTPNGDSLVG